MNNTAMRFLFGDRELVLTVGGLLSAKAETIILPAEPGLSQQAGMALEIKQQAGERVEQECAQLIREYGVIDCGMAVFTSAGELSAQAIIHAVVPEPGASDPQRLLETALSRSLQLCDVNEWHSLACPVLDLSSMELTIAEIAASYFRVITHFWDARQECALEKVVICASQEQFRPFFDAFREQGFTEQGESEPNSSAIESRGEQVGEVELSEDDISLQDNSDIDSWFK